MTDFKTLIDCIRKEDITLFIGSGFSLKAGAPSASSIVDAILKAMTEEERKSLSTKRELDTVAEEYEQIYNRESLLKILESTMTFKPSNTADHECLTRIPHFHHIITTNYDTLIEDTYGIDNAYVVRTSEDCINLPKDKVLIFKIHGDFKYKENIIITRQDYIKFFSSQKEPSLWNYIQSEILTKDILFIGYSLEDCNIFDLMVKNRELLNGHTRNYYLIAPGLKRYKIERLAKTNVTYYDAKAEDLFPILFSSLDKNIQRDYRRKRISFSTLSKYSNLHHLKAVASENEDHNDVVFTPIGNSEVNLTFSVDKSIGDKLMARDISLFTDNIPDSIVPAIKLNGDMLKDINISINGMTVGSKDDYNCLYLAPKYEEKRVSFRIEEIGFSEKILITQFKFNNRITISSKLECFTITFVFILNEDKSINCSCNVTSTEKYKNNSEALKWIELPIALWESKTLIISSIPSLNLKFPSNNKLNEFKKIKQYYSNIKEIELLYGMEFDEYNNYTNKNLDISNLLIQSFKEILIPIRVKEKEYDIEVEGTVKSINKQISCHNGEYYLAMTHEDKESIEFNGHTFTLKNKCTIQNCTILSATQISNEKAQLSLRINGDCIYIKYTNKDISEISELKNFIPLKT